MSNYTPVTNFRRKDSLATGDSSKIVTASELEDEFDAIATAIATKLNTVDVPTVVATSTQTTFTAGFAVTPVSSSGATLAMNCAVSNIFIHTYSGATVSVSAPTNPVAGTQIRIILVNAVGACTYTWNAAFKKASTMQPTQTSGRTDIAEAVYDGTNWLLNFLGKNFT